MMHPDFVVRSINATWLLLAWTMVFPALSRADEAEIEAETAKSPATSVNIKRNLQYAERSDRSGLCDVYLPFTTPPPAGHPVVVVVHGGGWVSGDKWTLESYSRALASHGMVAVTINYRLAPTHKFPAQVDDVRDALRWTRRNQQTFQLDLARIGMFGYSAGGHLSALIAALEDESPEAQSAASEWQPSDPRWQELPKICAVCVGGPPCDFRSLPIDNTALSYFLGGSRREKPDAYVSASPAAHVSPGDPVTQIIHGDQDLLVPITGSRQFHDAQVDAGIDSRMQVMPGQGHMLTFLNPKTRATMIAFFQATLQEPSQSKERPDLGQH
ncbi:MAG: alpha/beta hydrolase fold domain-containing protein [Rubripirellula sp.]